MKFVNSFIITIACILFVSSCMKKPDIEYTSTYKMSGEWFTRFFLNGAAVTTHHTFLTYNTSDPNSNQVWIDDLHQPPYSFRAKFDVDYANLAFKPMTGVANADSLGKTINLIEGKVIPGGGRSKSGNTVDSIYLKLEFSGRAGSIFEIMGHQRTGFSEDQY